MLEKGVRFRLDETIEGKKDIFPYGLEGKIVEVLERASGRVYSVQFVDGRVARFPEALMDEAATLIN